MPAPCSSGDRSAPLRAALFVKGITGLPAPNEIRPVISLPLHRSIASQEPPNGSFARARETGASCFVDLEADPWGIARNLVAPRRGGITTPVSARTASADRPSLSCTPVTPRLERKKTESVFRRDGVCSKTSLSSHPAMSSQPLDAYRHAEARCWWTSAISTGGCSGEHPSSRPFPQAKPSPSRAVKARPGSDSNRRGKQMS